jgi:hypothetical protein
MTGSPFGNTRFECTLLSPVLGRRDRGVCEKPQLELFGGLAISVVFGTVPASWMVPLIPKSPSMVPHKAEGDKTAFMLMKKSIFPLSGLYFTERRNVNLNSCPGNNKSARIGLSELGTSAPNGERPIRLLGK